MRGFTPAIFDTHFDNQSLPMPPDHLPPLERMRLAFRAWRRRTKAAMPYVRKREYTSLKKRYEDLVGVFAEPLKRADAAKVEILKSPVDVISGDVCLFVTHSRTPTLKPHVVEHIEQLIANGVAVVLIVNTDLPGSAITVPPSLMAALSACVVRENIGFDFAAWAHARTLFASQLHPTRLWWVNDSILGPLDRASFKRLIDRIRASPADMIGLTESYSPRRHLQSFFLVFGARALASPALARALDAMLSLPTKALVIEAYETRLTERLAASGLVCEAMFPAATNDPYAFANDTALFWVALVDAGFPFVKTSVVDARLDEAALARLVPERLKVPPV